MKNFVQMAAGVDTTLNKTLSFQVEDYFAIERDLAALFLEHDEEQQPEKRKKWNPDFARYHNLASAGVIHIPTARNADGELVGYWVFFVMPNLHYMSIKTAYTDLLYLRPAYRGGGNGLAYGKFMLETLAAIGVEEAYVATKILHDHEALFDKLGFAPVEKLYTRFLGKFEQENIL